MFYCPDLANVDIDGVLPLEESRHASSSRRLRVGDVIHVFDGAGCVASATIKDRENKAKLVFTLIERAVYDPPQGRFIVATAIPKGDRQGLLLDMLTQLGVTDIRPIVFTHSTWRQTSCPARWGRIILEASKQCRRPWLPMLHEPTSLDLLANVESQCSDVFVADKDGSESASLSPTEDTMLIVGPEGGIADAELEQLVSAGATMLRVSGNVLRVETAAIAATSVLLSARRNRQEGQS